MLANQIWTVGGNSSEQDVDAAFIKPFLAYTTKTHTTFTLNSESTYDWENDQWTIPLNLMVTQVLKMGKLPVSIQVGGRYYAETPEGGPDWGVRLTFTLLFQRSSSRPASRRRPPHRRTRSRFGSPLP